RRGFPGPPPQILWARHGKSPMRYSLLWSALGTAVIHGVSCRTPTEITLLMSTDVGCAELHGTTVTIGGPGSEAKAPPASSKACGSDLGSLVVVPSGAKTEELFIKVVGGVGRDPASCVPPQYGPDCIVARRAIRFVPHAELRILVPLRAVCKGVACSEG